MGILALAFVFLFWGCSSYERDNPTDPGSEYYNSNLLLSSSSLWQSSSSATSANTFDYKGQTYRTVTIGTQTWMAENLNYDVQGSFCYNNLESNCDIYGRMYNWVTAMEICPENWHLPTEAEWEELISSVGSNSGTKLKTTSGWYDYNGKSSNGEDKYTFSALPGGNGIGSTFSKIGETGYWWTATEASYGAFIATIHNFAKEVSFYDNGKQVVFISVRCVKDELCGSQTFNGAKYFCNENTIYNLCGGSEYSPVNQRCGTGNVVETKCGTGWYNATNANLRCQNNVIETKCGTEWYNAVNANLRCENDVVETQCGTEWYNTETQVCSDGTVKTYGTLIDTRDNQTYRTIEIGTQTWMAQNLNYNASGKCYGDIQGNCVKYGRLYNWATAMSLTSSCNYEECASKIGDNHQGICPEDWHIPSDAEWTTLTDFVGTNAGKTLKSTSGWNNNGNGTNDYGFTALPSGFSYLNGAFNGIGNLGDWWSASEYGNSNAKDRTMSYSGMNVGGQAQGKSYFCSVRCVKN